MEGEQLIAKGLDQAHFAEEHLIQILHVRLHVAARLVNAVQQVHFILDHRDDVVDVGPVS